MNAFQRPDGVKAASLRRETGLTQEKLAEAAGVDRRTVQRVEAGECVSAASIAALAMVLQVSPSSLYGQNSVTELVELAEDLTCRTCGARLEERRFVDHEYGDAEWEIFACGAERGWRSRPCPRDPRFPSFSDYELEYYEDGETVCCTARGKTDMARAVDLQTGFGITRDSASRWVERSYIWARDGYDAAEAFYPLSSHR